MKTNEIPEKIYLQEPGKVRTERLYDNDVEYTRTDALIEKAEKFLEDNLTEKECKFNWGDWTKVKSGDTPIASFIRAFRNYMRRINYEN